MNNEEYMEMLGEELKTTGKIHIPHTPPKATTAEETDKAINTLPNDTRGRLDKYLSLLNESGGAVVPYILAEIQELQRKSGKQIILWDVFDSIIKQDPEALALLARAREQLKKAQLLESPENKFIKPLPAVETYGLQNDSLNRDLICSEFLAREIDGQLYMVFGANQGKKGQAPVNVIMALSYEGEQALTSKRLTGYDRAVYNAVSTLYHYHGREYSGEPCIITPQEIWRTMNGITDKSKNPSPAQVKKVCSSIDKMRFTRILLDISDEIKKHNITFNDERVTAGKIDTYYLKADRGNFITENGRVIDAYRIDNEPILYSYNQAKKRVIYIPFNWLNTAIADRAGNEGNTIEIREYLLYQIMFMYNGGRQSRRILFETLYNETGLKAPEDRINRANYSTDNAYKTGIKKEAARDREKVFELLEAWKAKGIIKGYEKAGQRPIIGVDIELLAEAPTGLING